MLARLKAVGRVFLEAIGGWLGTIGYVFAVFALFSLAVTSFNFGLSTVFEALFQFYEGFRQNIFWPFTTLFGVDIPEWVKDAILVWSITGGIAMHTLLWFTSQQNRMAAEALEKSKDEVAKRGYIQRFGKEKYDEEIAFLEQQLKETTPPSGFIFKVVTVVAGLFVGLLGVLYVVIVNPHHRTLPVSARQLVLIEAIAVVIGVALFSILNFMLPQSVTDASMLGASMFAPLDFQTMSRS